MRASSGSRRCVVKREVPGRRRSSSAWTSATSRGMRGGQPSTTHPIPAPWLSPKVVTRKRCPKVLWDMMSQGFIRTALHRVKHVAAPHSRHSIFIANSSEGVHALARQRPRVEQNGECRMMKTLTAIGISAAIVFAPLAAIAQTDTTAPAAAAPAATDNMAPAKPAKAKHKKHMAAKKAKKPAADDAMPAAPAEAPKS